MTTEPLYHTPFPLARDDIAYRQIPGDYVQRARFDDTEMLKVDPGALVVLAREAMRDASFLLRPAHLAQVAAILEDPEASDNDRNVAVTLLRNAEVAARGRLPLCQDTGTAVVFAKKGQQVWTGGDDEEFLTRGIHDTFQRENLRYSQTLPLAMYEEQNSGTNLPAQIDIAATSGMTYEIEVENFPAFVLIDDKGNDFFADL